MHFHRHLEARGPRGGGGAHTGREEPTWGRRGPHGEGDLLKGVVWVCVLVF